MQKNICVVVARRIQFEELIIERVRNPSQRMPVCGVERAEGPANRVPTQASLNMAVGSYVYVIVVVHESVLVDGVVDDKRAHDEHKTQNQIPLLAGSKRRARRTGLGCHFAEQSVLRIFKHGRIRTADNSAVARGYGSALAGFWTRAILGVDAPNAALSLEFHSRSSDRPLAQ